MRLTVNFPQLDAQRRRLGAPLSDSTISTPVLEPRNEVSGPRDKLLDELADGVECGIEEIEVRPGYLLSHQGEQILVYIKDTRSDLWTLRNRPWESKKFHISDCRTLKEKREEGTDKRFVKTIRMDGYFRVDYLNEMGRPGGTTMAKLKVCKNCLTTMNWRGYKYSARGREREAIWRNFLIPEFLGEYSTFFRTMPSRWDNEASLNRYVHNWPSISARRKRAEEYLCYQCGVKLPPNLLHCHHVNGVVTDNPNSNLRVLCALCHAKQPGHRHLKIPSHIRDTIRRMRADQGIETGSSDPSDAAGPVDCTE